MGAAKDNVADQFEDDIVHDGTRYITKLPLKPDHEVLADNFNVRQGRLESLKSKLLKNGILSDYDKIFVEYEKSQIIKQVPSNQVARQTGHFRVDHLPHAFQYTGVDFAGPVFVKDGLENINLVADVCLKPCYQFGSCSGHVSSWVFTGFETLLSAKRYSRAGHQR